MLDSFSAFDPELIRNIFGQVAASEFARTCAIFGLAAFVHSKQVRQEIKTQFGGLIAAVREDLTAQREILGKLGTRVDKIEDHLQLKGETK